MADKSQLPPMTKKTKPVTISAGKKVKKKKKSVRHGAYTKQEEYKKALKESGKY